MPDKFSGIRTLVVGLAAVAALLLPGAASADETFGVSCAVTDASTCPTAVYPFPATTVEGVATVNVSSWDIHFVDPLAGLFALAERNNASVDVLNLNGASNGTPLTVISPSNTGCTMPSAAAPNCAFVGLANDPNAGRINDISGPNGVWVVNQQEIWAADAPTFGNCPGGTSVTSTTSPCIAANTNCQAYVGGTGGTVHDCYNAYILGQNSSGTQIGGQDNCDSTIKVLDSRTQEVTHVINTGGCFRADEGAVDQSDGVAIVANDAEADIGNFPFVTLMSTKTHTVTSQLTFDGTNGTTLATGGIEQPQWNPRADTFVIAVPADGGTFAAPSATGALVILNPTTGAIVSKFPITGCTPNGVAIGPFNEAVLGCSNGPVQVVNVTTGALVATISQIGGGCDEVYYEASQNHYVAACSAVTPANPNAAYNVGVIDAATNVRGPVWDTNITTKPTVGGGSGSPHSVAADDFTGGILVTLGAGNALCTQATTGNAGFTKGCLALWQAPAGDPDDANMDTYGREHLFDE
jgi:hypothetical protein